MRVTLPGMMRDFATLKPGDFFMYFANGSQHWGMLTTANGVSSPISFTEPIERRLPVPCVHDRSRFENRIVLVIENVEMRTTWPPILNEGSPKPSEGIGTIIMAETS